MDATLDSMTIVLLPDDDERFDGVPTYSAVVSGYKLFVRESEWPTLRGMLSQPRHDAQPQEK